MKLIFKRIKYTRIYNLNLKQLSLKCDYKICINKIIHKITLFVLPLALIACSGKIDKCVQLEMDKFYADKKSGRHVTDIIYKQDGSIHKKVKRSAEVHEKLMKNNCLKKHFKKD